MKEYVVDYTNELEYRKLERALKKYNMVAFKKLFFEYYPALRIGNFLGEKVESNKMDGTETYELKLPSDKMFARVHGDIKLIYTVCEKAKKVLLDSIEPKEILLEGNVSNLIKYKGVMISKTNTAKDKFKVDLLNILSSNNDNKKY